MSTGTKSEQTEKQSFSGRDGGGNIQGMPLPGVSEGVPFPSPGFHPAGGIFLSTNLDIRGPYSSWPLMRCSLTISLTSGGEPASCELSCAGGTGCPCPELSPALWLMTCTISSSLAALSNRCLYLHLPLLLYLHSFVGL